MDGFPSKEYGLIERIKKILPPINAVSRNQYELTIGDDAAVRVNSAAGERIIVTTDIFVENVHFRLDTMTFEEIGYKSMAANLSDCAAMGAAPDGAVVQLVFPKISASGVDGADGIDVNESILKIYAGLARACERWGFPIVGGDLSSGNVWTIGVTLLGAVRPGERIARRTGIVDGDVLWVTGIPGMSAAGLACLRRWGREGVPKRYQQFVDAHVSPVPRTGEGRALAACESVHAMMDLSDGLSKDVGTLCHDNGLGFVFDEQMPSSIQELIELADELGVDWRDWYYHGGEEYELLVACDPPFDVNGIDGIDGVVIMRLGHFTSKASGISIRGDDGGIMALPSKGWDHCNP